MNFGNAEQMVEWDFLRVHLMIRDGERDLVEVIVKPAQQVFTLLDLSCCKYIAAQIGSRETQLNIQFPSRQLYPPPCQ